MVILDPGHAYSLLCLDGNETRVLQFVKRTGPGYPGNTTTSPGTNLQSVLRACLDRVRYLRGQKDCFENLLITWMLQACLWLLEFRAARRHGAVYRHGLRYAEVTPQCPSCGHTVCEHA